MPTPREIADQKLFADALASFRKEIDEKAAQGGTSHEREIHPTKPIKAEDIEKSSLLKQAVEDFAKGGITLTFFREDYVRAFLIKEDHWFRATW